MKLIDFIKNLDQINEDSFLYVKRVDNKFSINSDVKILELNEEEMEWKTTEVTKRKCPGFEYFMETFLIKEFIDDLKLEEYSNLEKKCARLIHYVEFDA
ncbi:MULTISPECIES: hypothetical protein [Tenacibaculum]|uniref:hypothetical protein n=1 Tax=Tenacibaculum TaxID=104267 RepID=UPI001F38CD60|nr:MULTISPECIES: hypothetical protein [Tenacibaculum]MCF2875566.1 hypothetical protein [Tenacibaculum sp. Cn5-1]MCF2935642.1 hypothetical protein [Tenacibaculum sp. Cn5-34]MCG7512202.1 hypothetical protein [Tenacibaculum sp. Cn5-46]